MPSRGKTETRATPPESPSQRKRIVLVDDHPVFRAGLVIALEYDAGLEICAETGRADEAIAEIQRCRPDLVITDIGLPDQSGIDLIRHLRELYPDLPVLVISMHDERLHAERVLRAGGRGYVMKDGGAEKISSAVHRVLAGKVAVSDSIAASVLDSLARPGTGDPAPHISRLSSREFEVLRLVGKGKDVHEVARTLHVSIKTVNTHRANIRAKLGLKSGVELIRFATRWLDTH